MNYIGSKYSLLKFIERSVHSVGLRQGVFCDLFAGTAVVGHHFKKLGFQVIANDWQEYAYVFAKALVETSHWPHLNGLAEELKDFSAIHQCQLRLFETVPEIEQPYYQVLEYLNALPGVEGFIYRNYCPGGSEDLRRYYSDANGRHCDAIRQQLNKWKQAGKITEMEFYLLLATLLEAIDAVANTASVYGAFLKQFKSVARKPLLLRPLRLITGAGSRACKRDANELSQEIECDVLYLDPPYNGRQFSSNYHVLETIAAYDAPPLTGKTGLRPAEHQKSRFCSRRLAREALREIIHDCQARHIFLSYNDEGIISHTELEAILRSVRTRRYHVFTKTHPRFRADIDRENRRYAPRVQVTEYLFYIEKDCAARPRRAIA
ncbi:MAG: DNA adenine methylase [Acidobacteriota bacterium]